MSDSGAQVADTLSEGEPSRDAAADEASIPKPPTEAQPSSDGSERLSMRLSANSRNVINEIKKNLGYKSDADVIRHALGTQARIGEAVRDGQRIYIGDKEGRLLKELVFVPRV